MSRCVVIAVVCIAAAVALSAQGRGRGGGSAGDPVGGRVGNKLQRVKNGLKNVAPGRIVSVCSAPVATVQAEPEAITQELDRVLSSPAFARNGRQSQFLRFLVERHLQGRESELKESVIALEVFGRNADYDPKLDAIVRTEAIRLRARLEKYYAGEGSQDPLVIELPKGGYRPVFRERAPLVVEQPDTPRRRRRWIGIVAAGVLIAIAVAVAIAWRARARPESLTIAILPFENLSRDSAHEPFADALTDEVIRSLSLTEGLTVRSRTSSFALKGKQVRAADAGGQLGANYLVEGSVLQAAGQLRVNVKLLRAADDVSVWSQRFDRRSTDMFALQDEISRGIVNSLRLRLAPRRSRYETNLEAYELYVRGRQAMESFPMRGRPVAVTAVQYFAQAIRGDANYALAYAGMADALLAVEENMGKFARVKAGSPMGDALLALDLGKAAPTEELLPWARAAAARAVDLDPLLSESESARAAIRAREYAWQEAEHGFRRAIELNPNNALAHLQLGFLLLIAHGRANDGLAEVHIAAALDPLSPYMNTELGRALLLAQRGEESARQLEKAITLDHTRNRPYNLLGRAL